MPTRYVAHGLALAAALDYLREHWIAYTLLIPEQFQDGAIEKIIFEKFSAVIDDLREYATTSADMHLLTNDLYDRELTELRKCAEYMPIEHLSAIVRMHADVECEKDRLAGRDGDQ